MSRVLTYSVFGQNHNYNLRRHGSPIQEGVTVPELRPSVALIDARKARSDSSEEWTLVLARLDVIEDYAKATAPELI